MSKWFKKTSLYLLGLLTGLLYTSALFFPIVFYASWLLTLGPVLSILALGVNVTILSFLYSMLVSKVKEGAPKQSKAIIPGLMSGTLIGYGGYIANLLLLVTGTINFNIAHALALSVVFNTVIGFAPAVLFLIVTAGIYYGINSHLGVHYQYEAVDYEKKMPRTLSDSISIRGFVHRLGRTASGFFNGKSNSVESASDSPDSTPDDSPQSSSDDEPQATLGVNK